MIACTKDTAGSSMLNVEGAPLFDRWAKNGFTVQRCQRYDKEEYAVRSLYAKPFDEFGKICFIFTKL